MVSSATELLQALIRIPSVNPGGNPGVERPGEAACAEYVAGFLRACGASAGVTEVLPGRPNVVGSFATNTVGKKRIVFAPHTDTVSVAGMTIPPFGAELRDGRVYGRGASDTKGPMAAMLWALYELRDEIPKLGCEIWFAGLMGEEAGQHGAYHFVKNHRADFAIIGEPTSLGIVHTHKGSAWLGLKTHGRAVHASRPELGDNAILKMHDLLAFVRGDLTREFAQISDPVLGSPTISVATINGGTKTNIVPDFCEATVDIRTVPAQCTPNFASSITGRLKAICPDAEIKLRPSLPLYTDPASPFIRCLEEAGAKCTGAPWFCDAAVFAAAGVPAIAIGPGSIDQAHTDDEWIAVQDLERGVDFFRRFLKAC